MNASQAPSSAVGRSEPSPATLAAHTGAAPAPSTPVEQTVAAAYQVLARYLDEGRQFAAGQSAWNNSDSGLPAGWTGAVSGVTDILGALGRIWSELARSSSALAGERIRDPRYFHPQQRPDYPVAAQASVPQLPTQSIGDTVLPALRATEEPLRNRQQRQVEPRSSILNPGPLPVVPSTTNPEPLPVVPSTQTSEPEARSVGPRPDDAELPHQGASPSTLKPDQELQASVPPYVASKIPVIYPYSSTFRGEEASEQSGWVKWAAADPDASESYITHDAPGLFKMF